VTLVPAPMATSLQAVTFCFPTFSAQLVFYNYWVGYGYREPGLLFDWWQDYPTQKLFFVIFCVSNMVVSFFATLFCIKKLNFDRRRNNFLFWRHAILPIVTLVWQFFIGLADIMLVYFGLSMTTLEMVFVHAIAEYMMLSMLIILYRKKEISWDYTQKYIFWFLIASMIFQIIESSAGHVPTQSLLAIAGIIPDFVSPAVTTVYLFKRERSLELILLNVLLFLHIFTFFISIAICTYLDVVAVYFTLMMGVNTVVSIAYSVVYVLQLLKPPPVAFSVNDVGRSPEDSNRRILDESAPSRSLA